LTTGEGGVVVTNNKELEEKARKLKEHGTAVPFEVLTAKLTPQNLLNPSSNYSMYLPLEEIQPDFTQSTIFLVPLPQLTAHLQEFLS
jgi:hypothetical protein